MTRRVLVAALAVIAVLLALAGPAAAHSELVVTVPAAGSVIEAAPPAVLLQFNEPVEIALGGIRLFDGQGRELDVGAARHPDGNGNEVTADLPALDPASYIVSWRVQSADGHPVHGAFSFQVGTAAEAAQPGLLARILSQDGGNDAVSGALAVSRLVAYAALAVLVGGLALLAVVWPGGIAVARVRWLLWGALAAGLVASVAAIGLQGPYATGRGLSDAFRPHEWGEVLRTRTGRAWGLRVLLLGAGAALLATVRRLETAWWRALAVIAGAALLLAVTFAGHGGSGQWPALGVAATVVHLAGMAVWVGGLAVLFVGVLPRAAAEDDDAVGIVGRFSSIAFGAVVAIVVSGVAQTYRQVGSLGALTDTSYGRLLLIKTAVVVAMIAAGGFSRRLLHHEPQPVAEPAAHAVGAAVLVDETPQPATGAGRQLRRSVGLEVVLAVVVLAVTSLLVAAPPARSVERQPFNTTVVVGERLASITVDPAQVGRNLLHVYLLTPGGSLDRATTITVRVSQPERDVGPLDVPVQNAGPNHVTTDDMQLPFTGTWQLEVLATFPTSGQTRFATPFVVR